MGGPRVSVIMPVLDAERHLAEAVESVRAQTFDGWELLIVDDGSGDGSPAIAAGYAALDPRRIRTLPPDPERRGAAAARNRGIAAARAPLVALLDADDLYRPGKLAADLAAFDADPGAVWVVRATRWFHEDRPGRDWTERPGVRAGRSYDPPRLCLRMILREIGDVPSTCGVLMRKDVLEAVGGFEERFRLYEDQALWAKLMLAGRTRVGPGCDALYRQHAASTSAAAETSGEYHPSRPHAARAAFLGWLRDYAADQGLGPDLRAEIDRAVRRLEAPGPLPGLRHRLRRLARYLPPLG